MARGRTLTDSARAFYDILSRRKQRKGNDMNKDEEIGEIHAKMADIEYARKYR